MTYTVFGFKTIDAGYQWTGNRFENPQRRIKIEIGWAHDSHLGAITVELYAIPIDGVIFLEPKK